MWQLKCLRGLGVLLVFLISLLRLEAHEYWLEADQMALTKGAETAVRLNFGKEFLPGDERPLQLDRTVAFQLFGQHHLPLNLLDGTSPEQKPLAILKGEKEGAALLAMERSPANIVFNRARFLAYAAGEGREVSTLELPEAARAVHEEYSRYLKTLVRVGETLNRVPMKTVGQTFEIVPIGNPFGVATGSLTYKVLFQGEPLAGIQVMAIHRLGQKLTTVKVRTNARGKCILPLTQDGRWLIRSVRMEALPSSSPTFASFHSYWASLTFGYEG